MLVECSYADWPLDEPAVPPSEWVLFHPEQYRASGFPFRPLENWSRCRWYACREIHTGELKWVPGGQVFLEPGKDWSFAPALSTGLAAGRVGDPVVLRGVQEVIERDALVGSWWGRYPLEEHDWEAVFTRFSGELSARLRRPGLEYRFYRIRTPFSAHATVVTVQGEDRVGFVFSAGSACRGTRTESWEKSILEAIQGRHYVRHLLEMGFAPAEAPTDFAGHAVWYSLHPRDLRRTVLSHPAAVEDAEAGIEEDLDVLRKRLAGRAVLFRLVTPSALVERGWVVVRVVIPGLQPLHGHHGLPFLGGPLWAPRDVRAWGEVLPHPFP
jgi:ribosomal protein S12 methylthiotransferase accessory factor